MDTIRKIRTENGNALPVVKTRMDVDMCLYSPIPIKNAYEAVQLVATELRDMAKEVCMLICLDGGFAPICVSVIGSGEINRSDVSIRDVAQISLLANAAYNIIIHNHPASPVHERLLTPSPDDIKLTDAIIKMDRLLGMELFDSIIVGSVLDNKKSVPAYYSMREKKPKKFEKLNVDKYSNALKWMGLKEDFIEWDGFKDANNYWGLDVTKLHTEPSYTAYCPSELRAAIEKINDIQKRRMDIAKRQLEESHNLEEAKRQILETYNTTGHITMPEHLLSNTEVQSDAEQEIE